MSLDKNERWNLEEVLDQRSGGCEASAGSDPPVAGWELLSGSSFLWEESGEGVLESSSQRIDKNKVGTCLLHFCCLMTLNIYSGSFFDRFRRKNGHG